MNDFSTRRRSNGGGDARGTRTSGTPQRWLYVVVFLCGAVLMGLEIVGSRILAPTFGSSIFVWGSLISVVLAALSLGYWLGGKAADRWPRVSVMALFIALPGVMVALMPLYYRELNAWILGGTFGARMGPLMSSVVLFLVPSIFLGTVSPFAVRLQARAVASVGKTAGGLYAVSTGGSIAGTMATAFYLISVMGVAKIVHALGITLLLVAAMVFLVGRKAARGGIAFACAVLLFGGVVWHERISASNIGTLYEKDTFYHHIMVAEYGGTRHLKFDDTEQSTISVDDPWNLDLLYTRTMALAFAFQPQPAKVLAIGLGGGSLPKRIVHDYPEVVLDAVEIDPEVVAVARRFFEVPDDPRLRLRVMDGRRFIREADGLYDLIFLDAYNSDTIPFHLTTSEFYRELEEHLGPGGFVCSNIIGIIRGEGNAYFQAMYRTLAETFPAVYVFPVFENGSETVTDELNVILVAGREEPRAEGGRLTSKEIRERAGQLGGRLVPTRDLVKLADNLRDIREADPDAVILTDDYAPVDNLRSSLGIRASSSRSAASMRR